MPPSAASFNDFETDTELTQLKLSLNHSELSTQVNVLEPTKYELHAFSTCVCNKKTKSELVENYLLPYTTNYYSWDHYDHYINYCYIPAKHLLFSE